MLGIGRRDGAVEVKHTVKNVLAAPLRNGGAGSNVPAAATRPAPAPAAPMRDDPIAAAATAKEQIAATPAGAPELYAPGLGLAESTGSKLFVGINIKLKGVEISDCD